MRARVLVLGALLVACGGAERAAPESAPGAEAAATPGREAATSPEPTALSHDRLRCALEATVHELGEPGDGVPSAPVALGDGFAVAFTRTGAAGSELYVQRARLDGTLEPAAPVRSGVHHARPLTAGDGALGYVVAIAPDGATEAIPLDRATGQPGDGAPAVLAEVPEDVALGPHGLVRTWRDEQRRIVAREGRPDASLPATNEISIPREQLLASGPSHDLVLVRTRRAVRVAAIDGAGAVTRSPVLFSDREGTFAEASVAAGPEGFAIVRCGPGIGALEIYLAGMDGVPGAPIPIPPPEDSARPAGALVRRYPRAVAVDDGWALSYWDGTGPALVRVDARGAVSAAPIAIRSGDERGGHTDARMSATADAIAVTWQVEPPRLTHGFPEEEPRRPGPRLAVLRCAE